MKLGRFLFLLAAFLILLTACMPANTGGQQQLTPEGMQQVYLCTKVTVTSGNIPDTTDLSYDSNGNLVLRQRTENGRVCGTTRYTYDDHNNILTEAGIHPDDGHVTYSCEYTYSDQGYQVVRKSYNLDSTLSHEYSTSYDAHGRLLCDGDTLYYYDESGNMVKWENLTLNSFSTFQYENNNLLTQIYYERGSEIYRYEKTYDAQGHLLIDSHIDNGVEIDRNEYSYDTKGNKTEQKYFEYDILKYHTTYTYDEQGNLLEFVSLELSTGHKDKTTYTYDHQNRKLSEEHMQGNQPYRYTWTYDDFGNLVSYAIYRDGDLMGYANWQYVAVVLPTEQAQKVIEQQKNIFN